MASGFRGEGKVNCRKTFTVENLGGVFIFIVAASPKLIKS